MTAPTPYGRAALNAEAAKVRYSQPGERNDTLNAAAFNLGTLVPEHLTEDLIVAVVTDAALISTATAKGDDPLTDAEVEATITSGLEAGMDNPRQVPDGFGDREAALAELDHIGQVFDDTPMRGWPGRRMKRTFPGVLRVAYECGGPKLAIKPWVGRFSGRRRGG